MTGSRRSSEKGFCTLTIDVRNPLPEGPGMKSGRYTSLEHVQVLIAVLSELCGPKAEVFFDFGVLSVINFDLAGLKTRFERLGGDDG